LVACSERITVAATTTLNLNGAIAVTGGTISSRDFAGGYIKATKIRSAGYVGIGEEEYAYNSSTSTSTDTTSFAIGPDGAAIQNFAPSATSNVYKTVRFSTPIQSTDRIEVQFRRISTNSWISVGEAFAAGQGQYDGTGHRFTGIQTYPVSGSTTDVEVYFFSGAYWNAGTGAIQSWTSFKAIYDRWRVVKYKKGAPNGFANASSTNVGLVSTGTQTFAGEKTFSSAADFTEGFDTSVLGTNKTCTFYGQPGIIINNNSAAGSVRDFITFKDLAGDVNGKIEGTATANTCAYLTSSDARQKHMLESFNGLEMVSQMNPVKYERILDPGVKEYGFLAQELYEVFPQAVSPGGEDPRQEPWGVDYAKLTSVLTKAIQELKTDLDAAKAEIAALKAGV
jgi:hypothetical protein